MLLLTRLALGQDTLWVEDFSGLADGTTTDSGTTSWTSVDLNETSAHYFEVRSEEFRGSDLDSQAIWTSERIDISTHQDISLSMNLEEEGDLEIANNYVGVFYSIDGEAEQALFERYGDFGTVTPSVDSLNGDTLQIFIRVICNAQNEEVRFDNILVEGTFVEASLPVRFLSFSAKADADRVLLQWQTTDEENNRGYEVQRSEGGDPFTSIGFVKGTNQKLLSNYHFTDIGVQGTAYYRLKQLDFDGKMTFSKVVVATVVPGQQFGVRLYPNPFTGPPTLEVKNPEELPICLKLYNQTGKNISQRQLPPLIFQQVQQSTVFENLPEGLYFLRVETAKKILILKLIKK
ncbi:T9SS type A sorting domain-containing protein [Rapidithrix thailandica]|uniref:T9SS type A sorting domain-containing protein n=1 Tax=Rapidithrix thailandica TaxID=413964 RepID=A0AAW9SD13_9BACT